ncbi:rod shape-determining protein MreC [Enterococcus faecalis]
MKKKTIFFVLLAILSICIFLLFLFRNPFIENSKTLIETSKENKFLKDKIDNSEQMEIEIKNNKRTLDFLQKEKKLQDKLSKYDTVVSSVIERNTSTWYEKLTIDKGTKDGIEPNMTVLSQAGVIGRIGSVTNNTSTVNLLTASKKFNTNSFSVRIKNNDHNSVGILTGYDLKKEELNVSDILDSDKFSIGDIVTTAGIGGKTPADLPVGTVKGITQSETDISKHLVVKPDADFNDIMFVTIAKGNP